MEFIRFACVALALWGVEALEAVAPFVPRVENSIEELSRWNELEELAGFGARCAAEAPDGSIWFARRNLVARYDGRELETFELSGVADDAIIRDLHATADGSVVLQTDRYIAILQDGVWKLVLEEESEAFLVDSVAEAANGELWVAKGSELLRIRGSSLDRFATGLARLGGILIDGNGRLWVSSVADGGVSVFDLEESEIRLFRSFRFGWESGSACSLTLDEQGRVWVVQPGPQGGVMIFDGYDRRTNLAGVKGLVATSVSVAESQPGRMWFCVARRLIEYKDGHFDVHEVGKLPLPTSYSYILSLSGERLLIGGHSSKTFVIDLSKRHWSTYRDLNFQCEGKDGTNWFLHHDGRVVQENPIGDIWRSLGVEDGLIDSPNRIFVSSDGVVWVSGSHGGRAAVCYLQTGEWVRDTFEDAGRIISHLGVLEAADGTVLFGAGTPPTSLNGRKGGALVFRKKAGEYAGLHVAPPGFPKRTANFVERVGDGFWFGAATLTRRRGTDSPEIDKVAFFEDNWIDHLVVDEGNNLWAALWGKGVFRYDGEEWVSFDESNGLLSERVVCMLAGSSAAGLWVGTDAGLSRFDGAAWTNWSFPEGGRFLRENNTLRESSDGSLWLNYAYRSWLLEGQRDEDHKQDYRAIRYLRDQGAPETRMLGYDSKVPEGGQIALSWEGKDVWSRTPRAELQFSWKLDNQDWSPFASEFEVILSDLQGGSHQFEVRARDFDWNIDPTPAFARFEVILPLWKRTWFLVALVATLGLIVYLVIALFKSRVQAALAMEEFKLDFFTKVSHELRNPLAVIVGPLESLLQKESGSAEQGLIRIALRNARKMQGLVDQLLEFRKVEIGGSQLRPARGEIVGFVKDAIEANAPLWKAKRQDVAVVVFPEYLECEYDCDMLQKVLDNLLGNAIKYAPEEGKIEVRFVVEESNGELIANLRVEDSGPGISEHEVDLVTQPFYRANSSLSGVGFGIGLALVGQIVKLWGGELTLESPLGNGSPGTRVTAKLPLGRLKGARPLSDRDEQWETPLLEGRRDRILLVEDNLDLRLFLKGELSDQFELLEASNGRKGLEIAVREDPDLIISDVMMPVMDGFELCRQVRTNTETSHIPIILLTAKSAEAHSVEGIKAGADAYFPKPLNLERLRARVDQLLATRRRLKERFAQQLVLEPTELTVSSAEEEILRKAIQVVELRMKDEEFNVEQFADEMAMSRTTLYRKLKALTGRGPNPFIRSMRLKRAAQLLKTGRLTVSETLEHVGILDLSYFSRVFKAEFGVSPSDYLAEVKQELNDRSDGR